MHLLRFLGRMEALSFSIDASKARMDNSTAPTLGRLEEAARPLASDHLQGRHVPMKLHAPSITSTTAMSRRMVLRTAAVSTAGLAGMLATKTPPAYAATRTLTMLTWNHFVPASDENLRQWAKEFERTNKCRVKIDLALIGFQGRGFTEGVQPDFCPLPLLEALLFQSGDSSELAARLPCKGKSVRNRGVSQTMPFLVIPRSLLRGGFIGLKNEVPCSDNVGA